MAIIDFDVDDYLNEASEVALRSEVINRISRGKWKPLPTADNAEPWSRAGLAEDIRLAYYNRNASRFEMLLKELEQREEPTT